MKPNKFNFTTRPGRFSSTVGLKEITIGRFIIALVSRRDAFGGIEWTVLNKSAIRKVDGSLEIPTSGKIDAGQWATEELLHVMSQFQDYDMHLKVEAEIADDPEKYRVVAEGQMQKEEALLAKAERAMEEEKLAAEQAERDKKAAEEAARQEAERAAERADAERAEAARQTKLTQRIHEAAAREIAAREARG